MTYEQSPFSEPAPITEAEVDAFTRTLDDEARVAAMVNYEKVVFENAVASELAQGDPRLVDAAISDIVAHLRELMSHDDEHDE